MTARAIFIPLIVFLLMGFCFLWGADVAMNVARDDCRELQKFRSGGAVFDCKERAK